MRFFFIMMSLSIFAKVTPEDWKVAADPSKGIEHAVILSEKGIIDETFTRQMSRRTYEVKIKFLSKKGIKDYGTLTLDYNPPYENISEIKATVYLPNGTSLELQKKDIHKKKTSKEFGLKNTEISIAFPGLVEGAIVEYTYKLSFNGARYIYKWPFQGNLYCMRSQVRYFPWPTQPWGVSFTNSLGEPEINKGKYNMKPSVMITRTHIPPLKKEPYGLPLAAQRETVWFFHKDMQNVRKDYWTERGEQFYKMTLKKMFKHRKSIDPSLHVEPSDPQIIEKIYAHVTKKFISISKASKEERSHIDMTYWRKILKAERIGSLMGFKYLYKHQIDFVLGAYLASYLPGAQIEYALYLPWNEGFFNKNIQALNQFTASFLKVTYMGKVYRLSPRNRFLAVNQLPYGAYGNQIMVIGPKKVYFEQLPTPDYKSNRTMKSLDLKLDEEGTAATLTRKTVFNPFKSYTKRSLYFYFEEKELKDRILENLKDEFGDQTELVDLKLENLHDMEKPLIVEETFTVPIDISEAGDYLLFKTIGLLNMKKNPFNKEKRTQNIIFPYPYQNSLSAVYHFGESFVLPKTPRNLTINEKIFTYQMVFKKLDEHTLKVRIEEILERNYFRPEGGEFFRTSMDPILKAASQEVIIEEAP